LAAPFATICYIRVERQLTYCGDEAGGSPKGIDVVELLLVLGGLVVALGA